MSPEQMQMAGEALLRSKAEVLTDEDLSLVVGALGYVMPFLEGAGYDESILTPLDIQWEALQRMQIERAKSK